MGEHSGDMPDVDVPSLRSRQPGAIERWFLNHADAIYTFAFYRVGKDHDMAAEVVQGTFVMALDHIEQYEPGRGPMLAWLTGIAMNCIRRALRHRGRYEACRAGDRSHVPHLVARATRLCLCPGACAPRLCYAHRPDTLLRDGPWPCQGGGRAGSVGISGVAPPSPSTLRLTDLIACTYNTHPVPARMHETGQ